MENVLSLTKHAVAGSTKLAATTGGAHIYNIKAAADEDNGIIVKRGAYQAQDYYAEAAASATFAGTIIDKAANGNWYVEVTACDGDCIIITVPLIYAEYTTACQHESNFYNAKDSICRAYELTVGDVFEISAEGFDGTPVKGKAVSVASKKLKVATA